MKYDVVSLGNAALDVFFTIPQNKKEDFRFPLGAKVDVKKSEDHIGGTAANIAVGLARLGLNSACLTYLGEDYISREIISRLEDEKVAVNLIKTSEKIHPSISCILLSTLGERTILIHHGLDDYSIIKIPKNLRTKYLFLTAMGLGWEKVYQQALAMACEKNIKICLNPGNFQLENFGAKIRGLLKITEILFVNKTEAEMLVRRPIKARVEDLLKGVSKMGPKIVVITGGKSGADVFDNEKFYHAVASAHERVDTTGAGDAFAAGFLAKYIFGGTIEEALKLGIENSGSVIQSIGAQTGLLNSRELN